MYRHVPNLITIMRLLLTVAFFFILNNNDAENFERQMWVGFVVFPGGDADGYPGWVFGAEMESGVGLWAGGGSVCGQDPDLRGVYLFLIEPFYRARRVRILSERGGSGTCHLPSLTGVVPWMVVVLIAREFLITSIRGLAEAQGVDFRADWAGKIKMFTQSVAAGAVLVDLDFLGSEQWVHHDAGCGDLDDDGGDDSFGDDVCCCGLANIFVEIPMRTSKGAVRGMGHVSNQTIGGAGGFAAYAGESVAAVGGFGRRSGVFAAAHGVVGDGGAGGDVLGVVAAGMRELALGWAVLAVLGVVASVLLVMYGKWAAAYYRRAGPGAVRLDEYAGFAVTVAFVPAPHWCQRPWRVGIVCVYGGTVYSVSADRYAEAAAGNYLERLPWGWGILCDDLAAGVQANVVAQAIIWMWLH